MSRTCLTILALLALLPALPASASDDPPGLGFEQLAALRSVRSVEISPDGTQAAYTLSVPRRPGQDEDGGAWTELHLIALDGGQSRPYVHGEVGVASVHFTPDGRFVTYLAKRDGDEKRALWAIPVAGGESRKLRALEDEDIRGYRISPDGKRLAFVAREAEHEQREKAKDKGYKQEVFEEDWRHRRVWVIEMPALVPEVEDPSPGDKASEEEEEEPEPLEIEGSVFGVDWSPDGRRLVLSVAPTPLIDDQYMFQRIKIVDADSGKIVAGLDNPGKLGKFTVSPDGRRVAMISAADPNDPAEGRLLVGPLAGGPLVDLLPELEGHVVDIAWQDAQTVMFIAGVGVETRFGEVDVAGGKQKTHLDAGSPILRRLSVSRDGKNVAFVADSPSHPSEVFSSSHDRPAPQRRTDSNPWLGAVELARQEPVRWKTRDGLELEGVLIHPLSKSKPAPLLLMVHGGPEAHERNGWQTSYSRPGQLAAARGYAVLYPNYRGSTGRGVAFSKLSQGDAAGKEFDDLVDAVDFLAAEGIADKERVGINGGSYGGYATAWCATRYTDRFRAGVMFVGISNKMTKGLTTEIPMEDEMVHTRFDPWTRLQFSLERSPISHVEQSRTALLISGGTDDSRVHPSQSLQLYRALKGIGKTPVRYVRYPGEGHGNRKAAARDDYTRRLIRWMDHFVKQGNTELPPWDLELGYEEKEEEDGQEE